MQPLFKTIVAHCPPPDVDVDGPLQLQVTLLDYSSYVGAIGIGRIKRGTLAARHDGDRGGSRRRRAQRENHADSGLSRLDAVEIESAGAGDIVAFAGIAEPKVSDTLCDPATVEPLPSLTVDEPTISMTFEVNTSPFLGREGKFVTSRQIRERLERESIHNVALRVEPTADPDKFVVFGRGELHLGVLLENMRREGYEMSVSRPRVVIKQIGGARARALRAGHGRCRQRCAGRHHDGVGQPRRGIEGHAGRRPRARAPGLHDSVARTDRFSDRISHHDARHRPAASCVRSLRAGGAARIGPAPAGSADRQRPGHGARLFAVQPAGARQAVHRPGGGGLRGHDHRHQQPRQRSGGQSR